MSEDLLKEILKAPAFWDWLIQEHLKIKKHVSIPWRELAEAEPEPRRFDPDIVTALRKVQAAKEDGGKPSDEDLQTIRDGLNPKNPLLKFVKAYNWYHDDSDEGHTWAENILTELTYAKTLDDLQAFSVSDWHVCTMLLQADMPVPRKIIGELLEKIISEGMEKKADIRALGIKKPVRGRPSNPVQRERYLLRLTYQFQVMTQKQGMTATRAYEVIAEEQNKDTSTIRRDLERFTKKRDARKKDVLAVRAENGDKQAQLLKNFMEHQESKRSQEKD